MTRSRSHIRSRLGGSCSGRQYCYRAQGTAVEVVPGLRPDWIEIGGQPAGTAARIRIGRRNLNRRIWYALVPVTSLQHLVEMDPLSVELVEFDCDGPEAQRPRTASGPRRWRRVSLMGARRGGMTVTVNIDELGPVDWIVVEFPGTKLINAGIRRRACAGVFDGQRGVLR